MCKEFWDCHKHEDETVTLKIAELKGKVAVRKIRNPIREAFLRNSEARKSPDRLSNIIGVEQDSWEPELIVEESNHASSVGEQTAQSIPQIPLYEKEKLRQNMLKKELDTEREEKDDLTKFRDKGFGLTNEQTDRLKELKQAIKEKKKELKRLELNRKSAARSREKRKKTLLEKFAKLPEEDKPSSRRVGRPRLEETQPGLLDAIIDILSATALAHERRRAETLRSCRTLESLQIELKNIGYEISRSGLYLRLLPRNRDSIEGRRHVVTVIVKLASAQNDLRAPHVDTHFAAAQIKHLKDLAELFGDENVMVLSCDDKAKISLGIQAAKRQGPILMRVDSREAKVRLPDHDWVVGHRHKLIPSVYAGLAFKDGKLSYSGPTFVTIRSGKHDSSTAVSHRRDFEVVMQIPEFNDITRHGESTKPILIQLVDRGGDQRPANDKTLQQAITNFVNYNLDAVFVATHAPHQSASNPVERRMAPLSKALCGVVLPYQHYGNHLDNSRKTVDLDMEIRNFGRAGTVLKSIWQQMTIDGYPVVFEYVAPPGTSYNEENIEADENFEIITGTDTDVSDPIAPHQASDIIIKDEKWKASHVRQSKYLIQIVKCSNSSCCGPPRTNLNLYLPGGFLPPPVLYEISSTGIVCADISSKTGKFHDLGTRVALNFLRPSAAPFQLPNDFYCPSAHEKILSYLCSRCELYCVTKSSLARHKRTHKGEPVTEEEQEQEEQLIEFEIVEMPCIEDVREWWGWGLDANNIFDIVSLAT